MRKPGSVASLETLGRVRLSDNFFMRDFLYSEIANFLGVPNMPDDPDLAIEMGSRLCQELLDPLQARFGRISIRSAYRSVAVNAVGNERGFNCASNESNYAGHIWDRRDQNGFGGATACIVVNRFIPYYEATGDWQAMAWWVHDHLPHGGMEFFPKLAAFNLRWHEQPVPSIYSHIAGARGWLTKAGAPDHHRTDHADRYAAWLAWDGRAQP